jgi:predicted methyltransferase
MPRLTERAHDLIRPVLGAGEIAIDATVGNGHDTLFLAGCVGVSGRVFGFDVQASALARAAERVAGSRQVTLVHTGHERMAEHIPVACRGRVAAIMFNLGYLPCGDKTITTRPDTTLAAFRGGLSILGPGGRMTLLLYRGHPGGSEEAAAVRAAVEGLPGEFSAHFYGPSQTGDSQPELIVVERVR